MSEPTDHELLADYARTASEAAFAQLVARYINLVHSAAQRYAGNEAQAGEITQAVFLILARKAGRLSQGGPRRHVALGGWLYQTARLTAANALKAETRRQLRDHQAYMESQENQADAAVWREIAPLLDDAMGKLGETDRTVLVLRFFEGRTNAETAAALGLAEGAVQKRVQRALEKLRANFAKQGVTHTAQAIAGSVNRYAVLAAPAGLMALICANAAQGAIIATSITALANGALKTLAMTTIQKTLITATLIASVGTGLYEAKENAQARAEVRTLQQQQSPLAEQIRQMQAEWDKATNTIAGLREELAKNEKNNSELLKLRGLVGVLQSQLAKGSVAKKIEQPPLSTAKEYYERQIMHARNHEYDAQLEDLNKVIELNPTMANAYEYRGNLYCMSLPAEKGGNKLAVADYTRCLELKPNNANARWMRAMCYSGLKEYDKSIADWTTYIEGANDFSGYSQGKTNLIASALTERGRVYQRNLQDFSKAIADYTAAIQFNPNVLNAHRMRGLCYEAIGDIEKAQQDFAIEPKSN